MNKAIVIFIILFGLYWSLTQKQDDLAVHFLDVGQGDAILIRTPNEQNILIDGGEDNMLLYRLGQVMPWWDKKIDYLIITHYHADHMMGLMELLNKYEIKSILVSNHRPDDFLYDVWRDSLAKHNLTPKVVQAGEKFVINDDLYWQILLADGYHDDFNDNSVIVRLTYGQIDFLFMGDLTMAGESKLLDNGLVLAAEVIKVGHHGSKGSSGSDFLAVVQPQLCVIQSGRDNKFGHPHEEAVDRLLTSGCQILNNQDLGTISIFSDGKKWRF